MNKIVTRQMLAAELPPVVRGDIDPSNLVEVTVSEIGGPRRAGEGHFSRHFGLRRASFVSTEAVVAHIREVRDGPGSPGS